MLHTHTSNANVPLQQSQILQQESSSSNKKQPYSVVRAIPPSTGDKIMSTERKNRLDTMLLTEAILLLV